MTVVRSLVVVAAITHTPPDGGDSVEIPAAAARVLGLDDQRHWIRIAELNTFAWPSLLPSQPQSPFKTQESTSGPKSMLPS